MINSIYRFNLLTLWNHDKINVNVYKGLKEVLTIMKERIISIVILALSMAVLAACGSPASGSNETVKDEEVVNMPNPWQETTDIEEAKKGSGIYLEASEEGTLLDGFAIKTYRYMDDLLEVVYENGEDEMIVRLSTKLSGIDLNGDYTEYSKEWDVSLNGLTVHCKGDGALVNCANADMEDLHIAVLYNCGEEGRGLDEQNLMTVFTGVQASPLK